MLKTSKIESFPDGHKKITICNKPVFGKKKHSKSKNKRGSYNMNASPRKDSIRNTAKRIENIIIHNDFKYFATLTFDNRYIDCSNTELLMKKTQYYFKEFTRNNNNIFLYVPEIGKNGRIHIHAVIAGDIPLVCIGIDDDRHPIQSLLNWKLGNSFVKEIYDKSALIEYMTKGLNIRKTKIFKKNYYSGGKHLVRKPSVKYRNIPYDRVNEKEYTSPYNSDYKYKYIYI